MAADGNGANGCCFGALGVAGEDACGCSYRIRRVPVIQMPIVCGRAAAAVEGDGPGAPSRGTELAGDDEFGKHDGNRDGESAGHTLIHWLPATCASGLDAMNSDAFPSAISVFVDHVRVGQLSEMRRNKTVGHILKYILDFFELKS